MTIFGLDLSNNNGPDIDLNQVAAEGFVYVACKVSEGDYFTDATWPGYRDAAKTAGLLVIGYHYAQAACDPAAQAARYLAAGGPPVVMIDFEQGSGGIGDYWNLVRAFNAAGVTIAVTYLPHWYWQQIGSPDLTQVPGLIASSYVDGSGYASVLYPGDSSAGWAAYGNGTPQILQFTDQAVVAGHSVDANAFRGTRDQLAALLTATQPQGGETSMQLTDTIIDAYGNPVTVGDVFKWISFHADLTVDALGGKGSRIGIPPAQKMTGHPSLGGDDVVTALARIGQHLGLPGYDPAKGE